VVGFEGGGHRASNLPASKLLNFALIFFLIGKFSSVFNFCKKTAQGS